MDTQRFTFIHADPVRVRLAAPQTTNELGAVGEQIVAETLRVAGHRILAQNWRPRGSGPGGAQIRGEIDIVTIDSRSVVHFVEVKTRRTTRNGVAEAVTPAKLLRLRRLSIAWLFEQHERHEAQIDVAALVVNPPTQGPWVVELHVGTWFSHSQGPAIEVLSLLGGNRAGMLDYLPAVA